MMNALPRPWPLAERADFARVVLLRARVVPTRTVRQALRGTAEVHYPSSDRFDFLGCCPGLLDDFRPAHGGDDRLAEGGPYKVGACFALQIGE